MQQPPDTSEHGVLLRAGLLPGLIRFIQSVFKQLLDGLDYVLFGVEEYLRFHTGDGPFLLIVRTVLSALWFPLSYLIRFYSVVLIEPMINPDGRAAYRLTGPLPSNVAAPGGAHP